MEGQGAERGDGVQVWLQWGGRKLVRGEGLRDSLDYVAQERKMQAGKWVLSWA